MTTVTLYDDQAVMVDRLSQAMRRTKSPLLQSATGTGKTRMAAHMIDRARLKGKRAGFVVPRKTLFAQTAETFDSFNIPFGCFASGYKPSPFQRVQLISGGTLAKRLDKAPNLDVIFIDEAHFGGADLDRIIRYYQSMGIWVIGLSATPYKTNGQGMGEWYDELIEGPQISWLIENKRLSRFRMFAPDTPDLSGVRTRNGEFVQKDIDDYMMSEEKGRVLIGNAVRQYKKTASGLLNVTFCTSIRHAEATAQAFNDDGVVSVAVDGKTDKHELRRIIRAYANREIHNLCCAQLLVFGFDLAQASGVDVTIESMSDLAPSESLPWQLQKNGRVLRMKDFPAIMNDHAGNVAKHGLPDQDREWSLDAREKKNGGGEKTEPVRQCPECYMTHRPTPECPGCGFVYPVMSRTIEEVEGELQEVTGPTMKPKQEIGMIARTEGLKGLIEYGKAKGYAPGWARKQASIRGLR